MKQATAELLHEIDVKAEARKQRILSTPNSYSEEDSASRYYIAPDGNDGADGKTPETAWKTLKNVNETQFEPGTILFFQRGGLWRGQIHVQRGLTYTAYGEGAKPKFYSCVYDGAKDGEWIPTGVPNIYRYSIRMGVDVGNLVFNDGESCAYKATCSFEGDQPVFDETFKEEFHSWKDLRHDLSFYHDFGGPYVEMKTLPDEIMHYNIIPADLAFDTDFNDNSPLVDENVPGFVYLYSEKGNPAERFSNIEFLLRFNIFAVGENEDITMDNLCIKYGGAHGIGALTVKNLTVTNCEVGWMGGGMQFIRNGRPTRYGNGVEIYGGCTNYLIQNCYVYQCYDAGITHQYSSGGTQDRNMENVIYNNNLIEDCVYNIEYFLGESENNVASRTMRNILIENNILRFAGRGWGKQRPNAKCFANIKGWDARNKTVNYRIEQNILECSDWMMVHSGFATQEDACVYADNLFIQKEGAGFAKMGPNPTKETAYTDEEISKPAFADNTFYRL